jgi:hypothetical protein
MQPTDRLGAFPGVVAVVAGKNEMASVLKLHGGAFGLDVSGGSRRIISHGNTHLFIPCNGDSQRGTGNNTDEQHHPHKR